MTTSAAGERTLRGRAAIAGVGETNYYKRGAAEDPEFVLALKAILTAAQDAGIDPREIDGFASYSNDRNDPSRLAVATGMARCVVVFRALAQGQFARFGQGPRLPGVSGEPAYTMPYGLMSPAQMFSMRCMRHLHETGVSRDTYKAVSLAAYHHAQNNPRAVMHGQLLSPEAYDEARWIVEPHRLYDCCMENDGAAALIVVPAERARDLPNTPVYLLGATTGSEHRAGAPCHNAPLYATACFTTLAPRLYEMAEVTPGDVDVLQSYENFTGGVVMSIIEHGFCTPEQANEVLTFENLIAPAGRLPLNTSGGNLAECYMHGLELVIEAVRQIRGDSPNPVSGARVSMVTSGPMVTPASNAIFGSEEVL